MAILQEPTCWRARRSGDCGSTPREQVRSYRRRRFCRSQLVGEPGDGVFAVEPLANKFAPTDDGDSVGTNSLASQGTRDCGRTPREQVRSCRRRRFCRGQLVGERGDAVIAIEPLANKFAPTDDGDSVGANWLASQAKRDCGSTPREQVRSYRRWRFCRSQLVGEPGDAVIAVEPLANKFAPTDDGDAVGANSLASQATGYLR